MIKKFFLRKQKNPCIKKTRSHVLSVVNHDKTKGVGQDKCVHARRVGMVVNKVEK
jgi:hypothetical protein